MDLSAVIAAAREAGCVTIAGVQSAGKSRLARDLPGQLPVAEVVPDCVLAVELGLFDDRPWVAASVDDRPVLWWSDGL